MSHLTRRSFVKRTGAVTLGSALGLGLLPSVTRRLHAIDTSTLTGIQFNWTDQTRTVAYPPGAPVGTLVISVAISSTLGKNSCGTVGIVTVARKAVYTEVRAGLTYKATTEIPTVCTWGCSEGNVGMTSSSNDTSKKDTAIMNGTTAIGTLRSQIGSEMGAYKARVFWGPPIQDYGPWEEANAHFQPSCCKLA